MGDGGLDLCVSRQGQVANNSEQDNEIPYSKQWQEYLDYLTNYQLLSRRTLFYGVNLFQ